MEYKYLNILIKMIDHVTLHFALVTEILIKKMAIL